MIHLPVGPIIIYWWTTMCVFPYKMPWALLRKANSGLEEIHGKAEIWTRSWNTEIKKNISNIRKRRQERIRKGWRFEPGVKFYHVSQRYQVQLGSSSVLAWGLSKCSKDTHNKQNIVSSVSSPTGVHVPSQTDGCHVQVRLCMGHMCYGLAACQA